MRTAGVLAAAPLCKGLCANEPPAPKGREIYEWRVFNLNSDGKELDSFYADALIPAYGRMKIKTGAFTPVQAEPKRYYLHVYPDLASYHKVRAEIWNDAVFVRDAQPFYDAGAKEPVYSDFTSFLCEAFDKVPGLIMPDVSRTVFEWRHYKSPNEEANRRKVKMFNSGEIEIFNKTGINSVCYGDVLAGSRMPSLIYLTWYKDMAARDQAWKNFVAHPEWKRMSQLPEYANTATDNKSVLLSPLPYSQI
jgi:hypothetical protein